MLISKHTTKLQYSKQYGIDIKEDTQANGKEEKSQNNFLIYGELIFRNSVKTTQWRMDGLINN